MLIWRTWVLGTVKERIGVDGDDVGVEVDVGGDGGNEKFAPWP